MTRSAYGARFASAALGVLGVAVSASARAEEASPSPNPTETPVRGPLFHPDGPGVYALRIAVGAELDVLPSRVVESETRTIPEVTGHARFGFPYGFFADARLAAIVVTNELGVGGGWSVRLGDVSFAVRDRVAYWYGTLPAAGFDARGSGFLDYPGLGVGIPWGMIRFSLAAELIVILSQNVALGDAPTFGRKRVSVAGSALLLTVENILPGGGDWYYGAGVINAVPGYEAWVAFSDSRARFPYPRFVAGYAF
jgi:hypothetical protein